MYFYQVLTLKKPHDRRVCDTVAWKKNYSNHKEKHLIYLAIIR